MRQLKREQIPIIADILKVSSDELTTLWLVDQIYTCLLYTSDAADERSSVDLGGRRIIKKKKNRTQRRWAMNTSNKQHGQKLTDTISNMNDTSTRTEYQNDVRRLYY